MALKSSKELELRLERLAKIPDPSSDLEQYSTDAGTASHILTLAYLRGDVEGRVVADLGSGSGTFAYGACALGARKVYAVERDPRLAGLLAENLSGQPVEIMISDVSEFTEQVDTIFMNPPFGSVKPHADLPFLNAARRTARVVYSIHNYRSRNFIVEYFSRYGDIFLNERIDLMVPQIFPHHVRKVAPIPSVLVGVKFSRV
ncbi:MAG TPA: METTL5 family protein [Thermoplasmataceae archaeon]|nr:METTL5 family protein [Thermoplasmataceae archaeon]